MIWSVLGMFILGLLGCTFIGLPLNFVGFPYDRHISRRIPPPRFMHHYEYRLWCALMFFTQAAVLLLSLVGSTPLYMLLVKRSDLGVDFTLQTALGYFALGLVVILVPLLAFGLSFDRRIRADGPEPPAGPAEVTAFRRYLTVVLAVLTALVVAVSILFGLVS